MSKPKRREGSAPAPAEESAADRDREHADEILERGLETSLRARDEARRAGLPACIWAAGQRATWARDPVEMYAALDDLSRLAGEHEEPGIKARKTAREYLKARAAVRPIDLEAVDYTIPLVEGGYRRADMDRMASLYECTDREAVRWVEQRRGDFHTAIGELLDRIADQWVRIPNPPADSTTPEERKPSSGTGGEGRPSDMPEGDALVTLQQAAALARVSKKTLRRAVDEGRLPVPCVPPPGKGKAALWQWSVLLPRLRPIARRVLPERFPTEP